MSQSMKVFLGFGLGALALVVLGAVLWADAQHVGKAVTSARQLQDLPAGTSVAIYGGVLGQKGPSDPLALYTLQVYECETKTEDLPDKVIKNRQGTPVATEDGGTKVTTECDWNDKWRRADPFNLVVVDSWSQEQLRVPVVNSGFLLDGPQRTVYDPWRRDVRMVGFDVGDGVLVIGATTPAGVQARTVFGGTRDAYIGRQVVLGWMAMIGALICAAISGYGAWDEFR